MYIHTMVVSAFVKQHGDIADNVKGDAASLAGASWGHVL